MKTTLFRDVTLFICYVHFAQPSTYLNKGMQGILVPVFYHKLLSLSANKEVDRINFRQLCIAGKVKLFGFISRVVGQPDLTL